MCYFHSKANCYGAPMPPREYLVVVSCRRSSPRGAWQDLTKFLVSATSLKEARRLAVATTTGLNRAVWYNAVFRFSVEPLDLNLEKLRGMYAALTNPLHEPREVAALNRSI